MFNQENGVKFFKKACMVTLLAAGMLMGIQTGAKAIDFKAQGEWLVGFGVADSNLVDKSGGKKKDADDIFGAAQRIRLQVDAVASEALSGTVFFEIGTQYWGDAEFGGALGADGTNQIKVKNAYIDWTVPSTDLQFRMGLQALAMPNAAGGSAILDGDVAAVVANYKFNDNVSLTGLWMRPVNDNFDGWDSTDGTKTNFERNYLDNIDLFAVSLPLTFDGVEVTPWAMYGMMGKNALDGYEDDGLLRYNDTHRTSSLDGGWTTEDGVLSHTLINYHPGFNADLSNGFGKSNAYSSLFWFGLPISLTLWDPLNIEFEFDYGYSGGFGSYDLFKRGDVDSVRADTRREGWLVKALVEYKFDWGVPGIFGWYASGDDGDMKNGSKRMPSLAGSGSFTSFMGSAGTDWSPNTKGGPSIEQNMTYAGTWGVGLQVRDVSFIEDMSHTFRVALWGGTNSPSMTKYFNSREGWNDGYGDDGPYMTTNDNLLEFNLDNTYQMYENFAINLDLGYIVNMYDTDTWKRRWMTDNDVQKKDAWKAQVTFAYTF